MPMDGSSSACYQESNLSSSVSEHLVRRTTSQSQAVALEPGEVVGILLNSGEYCSPTPSRNSFQVLTPKRLPWLLKNFRP